jgi:hypothetical protein
MFMLEQVVMELLNLVISVYHVATVSLDCASVLFPTYHFPTCPSIIKKIHVIEVTDQSTEQQETQPLGRERQSYCSPSQGAATIKHCYTSSNAPVSLKSRM